MKETISKNKTEFHKKNIGFNVKVVSFYFTLLRATCLVNGFSRKNAIFRFIIQTKINIDCPQLDGDVRSSRLADAFS